MADTISPNMGLVVPGIGTEPSPQWATDLNSSLTILDGHNHSPGSGVQITPSGLNISSDLTFSSNNATGLRSSRYIPQVSPLAGPLDLVCVYVSGVDLYYNDENGNQIQITANGGVAGTSGSIANLTSPASASYVSGSSTFVWQSNTNTAANMDNGSVTIRKLTPSSPGITIAPPSGLSSNYTFTLPVTPPGVTSILQMDVSGNVSVSNTVGNLTTGTLSTGSIDVPTGDITVDLGNVQATAGDITATAGNVIANRVFPGGPTLASITSANTDTLLAGTSTGDHPIMTTPAFSTARVIAGAIGITGNIVSGGGFTTGTPVFSPPFSGWYVPVIFTTAFSGTPTVFANGYANSTAGTVAQGSFIAYNTVSNSGFTILVPGSGTGQANIAGFLALGPV